MDDRYSNTSTCRMGSVIFVETSAEAAAKREHVVIEEKMDLWVKAIDALNAACRDFSKYYVLKCDDARVKLYQAKEKNIRNLKKEEKIHRRALARQIALCGTRDELMRWTLTTLARSLIG